MATSINCRQVDWELPSKKRGAEIGSVPLFLE